MEMGYGFGVTTKKYAHMHSVAAAGFMWEISGARFSFHRMMLMMMKMITSLLSSQFFLFIFGLRVCIKCNLSEMRRIKPAEDGRQAKRSTYDIHVLVYQVSPSEWMNDYDEDDDVIVNSFA